MIFKNDKGDNPKRPDYTINQVMDDEQMDNLKNQFSLTDYDNELNLYGEEVEMNTIVIINEGKTGKKKQKTGFQRQYAANLLCLEYPK